MTLVLLCIYLFHSLSHICFQYIHIGSSSFFLDALNKMRKKGDDRSGVRTRATCVMGKFMQLKSHVLDHSTILPSSGIKFHCPWAEGSVRSMGVNFQITIIGI